LQIGAQDIAKVNHLNGKKKHAATQVNYPQILKGVKAWVLEKVLDIYELDFTMFGYDIQPFLNILSKKREKEKMKKLMNMNNSTSSDKI